MPRRERYGWSPSRGRAARRRAGKSQSDAGLFAFSRRLRFEPLEDRRLLANVTVSNLNDVVNGNVASIVDSFTMPCASVRSDLPQASLL